MVGTPYPIAPVCAHCTKRLDDALAMIERAFKETTVEEVLAEPTTSKPLCPFPHRLAQI